jgi:hypothetical protein
MRSILYFLFILFLEITCGIILLFVYSELSLLLFDKHGFAHSWLNELITYLVTLFPPFIYCWVEHSRFKREGIKNNPVIYLSAGIAYFVGGLALMLILTDFYLLGI